MACERGLALWFIAFVRVLTWGSLFAKGADPDITTDFSVPAGVNVSTLDGTFFTSTEFRGGIALEAGQTALKVVTSGNFPALVGQGVSVFFMSFQPGGVLPPHLHPRASKIVYVIEGILEVGFTDSTNKLFQQTLQTGDVFLVPKALVHFMANLENKKETKAIFFFGSSNPGTINLPHTLFHSGISDLVLEKSFGVPRRVVEELKAPESCSGRCNTSSSQN